MGIPLQNGSEVESYDANQLIVRHPNGQTMLVARHAAPADMQAAVAAAEGAGQQPAAAAPSAPTANPLGFIEGAPGVVGGAPAAPIVQQPTRLQQSFADLRASQQPPAPAAAPAAAATEQGPTQEEQLQAAEQEVYDSMPSGGRGGSVRTSTQRTAYDPETVERVEGMQIDADVAAEDASLAREEAAAAESAAQGEIAKVAGEQAAKLDAMAQQQAHDQQEHARRFETEQTKLKALQAEADTKIDPKRWWKEQSTGENILAALAIGLGSFGSSLTGTPNFALQIIDKAIERDIDAQLSNRDSKYKQVAAQQDLIGIVRGQYETKEQERAAARTLMLDRAATYIEQITARSAQETTRAKGAEIAANIRQQQIKEAQALAMQLAGQTTTQQTVVPGGGGMSEAEKRLKARQAVRGTPNPEKFVPGSLKYLGYHAEAVGNDINDINKLVASADEVQSVLNQMEATAKNGKLSPQARTNMESLRALLLLKVKNAEQLGALDAGSITVFERLTGPNATDLTTVTSALPQLRANVRAGVITQLKNRTRQTDIKQYPLAEQQRSSAGGRGQSTGGAPPTRPIAD